MAMFPQRFWQLPQRLSSARAGKRFRSCLTAWLAPKQTGSTPVPGVVPGVPAGHSAAGLKAEGRDGVRPSYYRVNHGCEGNHVFERLSGVDAGQSHARTRMLPDSFTAINTQR